MCQILYVFSYIFNIITGYATVTQVVIYYRLKRQLKYSNKMTHLQKVMCMFWQWSDTLQLENEYFLHGFRKNDKNTF